MLIFANVSGVEGLDGHQGVEHAALEALGGEGVAVLVGVEAVAVEGAGLVDKVGSLLQDQEGTDFAQDGDFVGSLVGGGFAQPGDGLEFMGFPFAGVREAGSSVPFVNFLVSRRFGRRGERESASLLAQANKREPP